MSVLFTNELLNYKKIIDGIIEGNNFLPIIVSNESQNIISDYLRYFQKFSMGGKRIRAYLVKLGYELCSGSNTDDIILPSLSYEVFQSSILIHDDIIDKSDIRRNMPTMHVALGNDHIAMSKSICMGDFGVIASIDMISRSNFDAAVIKEATIHQIKTFEMTIAGELKDIELSVTDSYSLEDVLEMYRLKTSWYTFIGPMHLGAILGNASTDILQQIEYIGTSMGIAFQIKDDIIGIFGSPNSIGKSNLSDMQEGKKTILTTHFLTYASHEQLKKFNRIYGNKNSSESDLKEIQRLFMENNTYEYANMMCKRYANKAIETIDIMNIDEKYKEILYGLIDYLCGREK